MYNTESYPNKEKPKKESSHLIILVVPSFLVIKASHELSELSIRLLFDPETTCE
jgi:hypothetical protein